MKIASLIAGVAAVALIAGSASAQTAVTSSSTVIGHPDNTSAPGPSTATFDITASVAADCVLGLSNSNDLNFGELGIQADGDAGVENAFRLAPGNNYGTIDTNMAGCNARNTVKLAKTNGVDGMKNDSDAGYDSNVFQANLPYDAFVHYTAGDIGDVGAGQTDYHVSAYSNAAEGFKDHGAWRSALSVYVNIPAPAKAVLAGDYKDELTLTLTPSL
ncbi:MULTISPECIES: spore coat protein U domain-containing protein [Brevundimonas]|uniref:spore coat protein U domain-containing protein n=1 Tax=Brevundimonas TaxID=41275 RepID=UPI000E66CE13|nr:spore coat protein U domain-containing protein [Brevundimonas sp. LPMIX5]RIJ66856.1 hypothetical protein D1604_07595 [Brevundimonas sp. LPMIX5]